MVGVTEERDDRFPGEAFFAAEAARAQLNNPVRGIELVYPKDSKMADTMVDRVMTQLRAFQNELADDEEVGACLAQFGERVLIHVEDVGYHNPELMIFFGENEKGDRVTLLQHLSQLNLLLVAIKVAPGQEPRRIGFDHPAPVDDPEADER